ncbi:MAG: hypothetical protein KC457_07580 [Myxococcales bacterium]|nr:hypothetical protein [Myxococcales bacterium]
MSASNPFVGPRPIQSGEPLHGRETEVRELHELLKARQIVVLHSPSGAGKSSLVQAGLIPRLRADKFDVWKPIRVNLDPAEYAGLPADCNRFLLSALVSLEDELPAERRRSPAELAGMDFLDYLDTRPRRKQRTPRSVVLLFDQFEEILSTAPWAIAAKDEFFAAIGRALDSNRYWALFIIREDYLGAFAPYRDRIPTNLGNTFRLDFLGLAGAREAAERPAVAAGRRFPAVDLLIRDLAKIRVQQADGSLSVEQGLHVEPVQLQVVCRRLWQALPAEVDSIEEQHIQQYGEVSESLAGYYAQAVASIAAGDPAVERALREWVGTKLIVEGIRSQVRQEPGRSAGLDNGLIDALLATYLVRSEPRAGGNWFELGHDRLVEPILEDNEWWRRAHLHPLQTQAQLWEDNGRAQALLLVAEVLDGAVDWARDNPERLTAKEQEFLDASLRQQRQHTRQRHVRRTVVVAMAGLTLAAVVAGSVAVSKQRQAELALTNAELAEREAVAQREEAERRREDAQNARGEALSAQKQAEQAQKEAEHQRQKVQSQARELLVQLFHVALRRFIDSLAESGFESGQLAVGEQWTVLAEFEGQPFAAANLIDGGGRIVVAGLESLAGGRESLFLEITVEWLLGEQARRGVAVLTEEPRDLRRTISALGYDCDTEPELAALANGEDVGVLIVDNRHRPFSAEELDAMIDFVAAGGGLLAVGMGKTWLEAGADVDAAPTLADYPMNMLLEPFEASWTGEAISAKRLRQSKDNAAIRFENRSGRAVNLFVRNREGHEEYRDTLAPDAVLRIRSALGRSWLVRSVEDDAPVGAGEVSNGFANTIIIIEATHLDVRKGTSRSEAAPTPVPEAAGSEEKTEVERLPETLSDAAMRAVKAKVAEQVLICGQEKATLSETVKVTFSVSPDGTVSTAEAGSPLQTSPVGICAAKAVKDRRFPESVLGLSDKTWVMPLHAPADAVP